MTDSVGDLMTRYRRAALEQRKASASGDHRRANASFESLVETFKAIRSVDENWTTFFSELLKDDSPEVRSWAATHLLAFDAAAAGPVLHGLAQLDSLIGFSAKMVLDQWDKGTFEPPI